MLDEAGSVDAQRFEVTAKQHWVPGAAQGFCIAGHQLIYVGVEPRLPCGADEAQDRLAKAEREVCDAP